MDAVQGNILPGFYKDFQDFVFVRFTNRSSRPAARRWVQALLPFVQCSSAREVAAFNRAFVAHKHGQAASPAPTTWLNLAFSRTGLQVLGVDVQERFPVEFTAKPGYGVVAAGSPRSAEWSLGGLDPDTEADAMLILAADSAERLAWLSNAVRQRPEVEEIVVFKGRSLGGGREHFGFKDGVSQPVPSVLDDAGTWPSAAGYAPPNQFVLDDERAEVKAYPWSRDGSYVVFHQFEQDVQAFKREMTSASVNLASQGVLHMTPELLKAKLVGRWPDGSLLIDDFASDPDGLICPVFAHIRKALPRDHPEEHPELHRIIRRGIPYGSPEGDDAKGLLFVSYQASIKDQFEHVYQRWLTSSNFPPVPLPATPRKSIAGVPQPLIS